MQAASGKHFEGPKSLARTVFGVVAEPQTWLNFGYHWLAFPLGLFYFVFLVTALSVGISLVIVLIGVPILLLTAAAWWCFAALERVQARRLLGAGVPRAPRPWERGDDIWSRLKAHFGAGVTWTDLAYLFLKFPMGLVSFVLCVTGASIVVAFIGAPFLQWTGTLRVAGERVDSWAVAFALVPVGLLALFAWMHLLNAWAWVSRRLAEALLRGELAAETPGAAIEPSPVPAAVVWQGAAADWSRTGITAALGTSPAPPSAPPVTPQSPQPVWVQTPYGWQPMPVPQDWPAPPPPPGDDPTRT